MDELEIKKLWQTYNKKLAQSLSLNPEIIEERKKMKAKSVLSSAKPIKILAIVVGILWVLFIDMLIIKLFSMEYIFFVFSAGIHSIVTKIAIGIYIYHLILINQIDNSQTVLEVQEKLAQLQTSTLQVTRLLFLQLPVFTTFRLNASMLQNGNVGLWVFQIAITLLFTFSGIWLFINIRLKNMGKKWFKLIFSEKEWNSVIKAMEFLKQIDEYKEDQTTVDKNTSL